MRRRSHRAQDLRCAPRSLACRERGSRLSLLDGKYGLPVLARERLPEGMSGVFNPATD
jgi:hypothetical protein